MAEYIGGICIYSPKKESSTFTSSSLVTHTFDSDKTVPVISRVSVVIPRRTVAIYLLSLSKTKLVSLVALPISTGKTPVAKGSSVPVWPTRLVLNARFIIEAAVKEVIPSGLSMSTSPFIFTLRFLKFLFRRFRLFFQ